MSVCAVFFRSEAQNVWLCPGSAAGGFSEFLKILENEMQKRKKSSCLMCRSFHHLRRC
jgi:hypothetical protein